MGVALRLPKAVANGYSDGTTAAHLDPLHPSAVLERV